jgi:hypothetical protein
MWQFSFFFGNFPKCSLHHVCFHGGLFNGFSETGHWTRMNEWELRIRVVWSDSPSPWSSCSKEIRRSWVQKRMRHLNPSLEKEVGLAIAAILLQRQLAATRASLGFHSPGAPPLPSLSSGCLPLSSCNTYSLQQERVLGAIHLVPLPCPLFCRVARRFFFFFLIVFEDGDFSIRNFHIWCSDVSSLKIAVEAMAEYDASQFCPRSLKCVLSFDNKQA